MMNLYTIITAAMRTDTAITLTSKAALVLPVHIIWSGLAATPKVALTATPYRTQMYRLALCAAGLFRIGSLNCEYLPTDDAVTILISGTMPSSYAITFNSAIYLWTLAVGIAIKLVTTLKTIASFTCSSLRQWNALYALIPCRSSRMGTSAVFRAIPPRAKFASYRCPTMLTWVRFLCAHDYSIP